MNTIEKLVDKLAQEIDDQWQDGVVADPGGNAWSSHPDPEERQQTVVRLGQSGGQANLALNKFDLDFVRLKEQGFITPDITHSKLLEELRVVKRRLLSNCFDPESEFEGDPRLIMVTSATSGEGKTFLAINLALSLATEIDRSVLLVDTDIVKGDMMSVLGVNSERGLTDVLARDESDVCEALIATNVESLTLLPAGPMRNNATELFSSEKMVRLVNDLSRRYPDRLVIFDTPPLLVATETHVLATLAGQVVLVVEAQRTTQAHLAEALEQLTDSKARVSLLLNKSHDKDEAEYYYGKCKGEEGRENRAPTKAK
ncbi:MAG: XrtA-associated tyrosine autokinase [Gammaproteobacteria bacterium]